MKHKIIILVIGVFFAQLTFQASLAGELKTQRVNPAKTKQFQKTPIEIKVIGNPSSSSTNTLTAPAPKPKPKPKPEPKPEPIPKPKCEEGLDPDCDDDDDDDRDVDEDIETGDPAYF